MRTDHDEGNKEISDCYRSLIDQDVITETWLVFLCPAGELLVAAIFGILGRTALQIDGRWDESWGRPRERAVLAVLLLHAGRPVRIDTLVEWIWPENVPSLRDRAATVQTYAARIRRSLMRINSEDVLIAQNGSYRVDVDRSLVDYFHSRSLVIAARAELRRGRPQQAVELASQAIALWRGQPLEDVQTDWARNWRLRVETDEWIPANTTFVEALIELGEFSEALIRVNEVSADHPHDLSLITLRLTALHGLARYSDVTTAYFTARRRLLDDSETQAADHLRQFHDNLINRNPVLNRTHDRTETVVVPRQLPNDLRDFIGRKSLLDKLDMASSNAKGDFVPGVIVVDGAAGVGKTSLVVHWAHRARHRFPDGDFHINLNGFSNENVIPPSTVVDDFLLALGISPDESMSRRHRELLLSRILASRRTLVLLDNAQNSTHVKDLIPLLSGSLVIVTSRQRLSTLSTATNAHRVRVEHMQEDEAIKLLSARLGTHQQLPWDVRAQIARLCGGLPLVLAIFAEHVATWSSTQIHDFANQLDRHQLIFDVGGSDDVATSPHTFFSWSYEALRPAERRLFRLLGLHTGPDISRNLACAYDGRTQRDTTAALGALVCAHLLEQPDSFDRYRFHDLLKTFAAHCAETDEPDDDRQNAEHRALAYYLASSANADQLLYPTRMTAPELPIPPKVHPTKFTDRAHAKRWFERERSNLIAMVRNANDHGHHDHVWRLADTIATFFDRNGYYENSREVREIAVVSARAAGLREAEASTLVGLGMTYLVLGQYTQARELLDTALRYTEDTNNVRGQASTLHHIARVEMARGNASSAVTLYQRCLDLAQRSNDDEAQCWANCRLGGALRALGQHTEALIHLHKSQWFAQLIGEQSAEALCLAEIGSIYRDQGHPDAAAAHCRQALQLAESIPDIAKIARICTILAEINQATGDLPTAIEYAQRSVSVCQQTHNVTEEARACDVLGDAHHASGENGEAVLAWQAACDLYDRTGNITQAWTTQTKIDKLQSPDR